MNGISYVRLRGNLNLVLWRTTSTRDVSYIKPNREKHLFEYLEKD